MSFPEMHAPFSEAAEPPVVGPLSVEWLRAFFGWDEESSREAWLSSRRSFSAAERARRRKKNKAAARSRRRNRA